MGEDEDTFLDIGDRMVAELRERADLADDARVLDVGCGYGRLAHALQRDPGFAGSYVGIDILERHVGWCQSHLADEAGRYRFEVVDLLNERYRPDGAGSVADLQLPVDEVDLVVFASVFTHLWPEDVGAYLDQAARVLAPGGRVYASFFLLNERWRKAMQDGHTLWPLPHEHGETSRFMDVDDPLHVIAHDEDWVMRRARKAGLEPTRPVHYGAWTTQYEGGVDPRPGGNHDWVVFTCQFERPS